MLDGNNYFNVFDEQGEQNFISALPPNSKKITQQILSQNYNHFKSLYPIHNNNYFDKENEMNMEYLSMPKKVYSDNMSYISDNAKHVPIFGVIKPQKTSSNNINPKEKVKIPYLKKFNPKSIKREEINKKVIRKFKKFIKDKIKKNLYKETSANYFFWKDFSTKTLLPPMFYSQNNCTYEFKSFNSNYIVWLFSQNESKDLYKAFLEENKEDLYEYIKQMIKVSITEDIVIELTNIFDYIQNFSSIYGINNYNINTTMSVKNNNENSVVVVDKKDETQMMDIETSKINNDIDMFSVVVDADNNDYKLDELNSFSNIDFFKK